METPVNPVRFTPAVAISTDELLVQGRTESEHSGLLSVDVIDFEIEMELLGVLTVGPLRSPVALNTTESQLDGIEPDARPVVVAATRDRKTRELRVERRQLHGVRAVDDEIGESQHPTMVPARDEDRKTGCPYFTRPRQIANP